LVVYYLPMQMLTIAESARLTGKHPDTIRRLIKRLLKEDNKAENNIKQELVSGGFSYRIAKDYLLERIPMPSAGVKTPMQEHMHTDMHTKFADGQQNPQDNLQQSKQPHRGMHTDGQANSIQSYDAAPQLLRETIELLKEQLREKDKQIEQLLERDRETNILLKGYQDRYILEAPKHTAGKHTVNQQVASELRKPHKFTKQPPKPNQQQQKKGFFSWFK
jgi:hypothetical protein